MSIPVKNNTLTQAQERVYFYLKSGYKINFNPEGSDPVFNQNGELITHICNIKTMTSMIKKGVIVLDNYEYKLILNQTNNAS